MISPVRSPPEGAATFDLAVLALSARALARSARRAGLNALAIDLFGDADTREHAALAVRAQASRPGLGFQRSGLLETLAEYAPEGLPVVLGSGFEHTPSLMRAIARRNPIVGASPDQVALLKNPFRFSALLTELGIPHPAVLAAERLFPAERGRRAAPGEGAYPSPDSEEPPHPPGFAGRPLPAGETWGAPLHDENDRWLSKRAGASGGAHIRDGAAFGARRYLQLRVDGRPVSALFLANGPGISIIGFSEQWPDPSPRAPYRYGGAAGPIALDAKIAQEITSALARIAAAAGLMGLASADLILSETSFSLLEINPRPGATLDVFDHGDTPSLLALHLDACAGRLPAALPVPASAQAAAIVYADRPVHPVALQRPVWTADWPSCDETVPAGAPFCTVLAAGASPSAARALVLRRRAELLDAIRAAPAPAPTNLKKAHA